MNLTLHRWATRTMLGLAITTLASCGHQTPTPDAVPPITRELRDHFTVEGRPVHPLLIKHLLPWLSDSASIVVGVDPAAAAHAHNQFPSEEVAFETGYVCWKPADPEARGFFRYKFLGTLADGTIVLLTLDNGGGSGVFEDLLFLQVVPRIVTTIQDGGMDPGVMLLVTGIFTLGDRDQRAIEVQPDHVTVGGQIICQIR